MELTFWQDVVVFFRSLRWRPTTPSRRTIMNILVGITFPLVVVGGIGSLILVIAICVEGLSPLLLLAIPAWGIVATLMIKFTAYYEDKYQSTW